MSLTRFIPGSKHFDWPLFLAVLLLVCVGLAALYSMAQSQDQADYSTLYKQIIATAGGMGLLIFFAVIDYRQWRKASKFFYLISLVLLVGVLFFGRTIRGTRGWLVIGGWQWQVVEAVKFCLIFFLADFLANNLALMSFKKIIQSGFLVLIFFVLVILQPDFGSAMVLFFIWLASLFFSKMPIKYWLVIVGLALVVGAVGWLWLLQDFQKDRILTFFDPSLDPYGRGYNVTQAKIAVGAGQIFGRGLGFGTQSQLRFIPEAQTDFIFAVVAEELGLVGAGLIIGLLALIFWRGIKIAKEARDDYGSLLIMFFLGLIFVQAFVNIGMNIGLLPVTGIALPFVSSGGSFLTICLALVGVTESVAYQARKIKYT
ncbi:MAG: rod shape-determining protein RodA [Candidatus Buchananbacteria bacterium]